MTTINFPSNPLNGDTVTFGPNTYIYSFAKGAWDLVTQVLVGPTGSTGPANSLSIGTVTSSTTPSASITGTPPNQTLNLVLAKGDTGAAGPTGLQYQTVQSMTASTTLTSSYASKLITADNSSGDIVITLNSSTGFTAGQHVEIIRNGTSEVSIATSGGSITLRSPGDRKRLNEQFSSASLICISSNNYRLVGDLKT